MARVQISLSDDEKRRWQAQARREGMSLSAWMHDMVKGRADGDTDGRAASGEGRSTGKRVHTEEDREAFFRMVDALHGPNPKPSPTWEEINRMLGERMREKYPQA